LLLFPRRVFYRSRKERTERAAWPVCGWESRGRGSGPVPWRAMV